VEHWHFHPLVWNTSHLSYAFSIAQATFRQGRASKPKSVKWMFLAPSWHTSTGYLEGLKVLEWIFINQINKYI
jgi:hypothetical protein